MSEMVPRQDPQARTGAPREQRTYHSSPERLGGTQHPRTGGFTNMWPRRDVPRWRCPVHAPDSAAPWRHPTHHPYSRKIPGMSPPAAVAPAPPPPPFQAYLKCHLATPPPPPCAPWASLLLPALDLTSPEELAHPDWFPGLRSRKG